MKVISGWRLVSAPCRCLGAALRVSRSLRQLPPSQ
jgi:hypothetical protein